MIKADRGKLTAGDQRGVTLVELLVVIALLGVVLAIPLRAFFLTNRDWQYNQAMSSVLMDSNLLCSRLSREIRSAEKPATDEVAVEIVGNRLILYLPSGNRWERVEYRHLEASSQVQRGSFTGTASEVLDRDTNPISSWITVASGVTSLLFSDITAETTGSNSGDRRLIKVAMYVGDTAGSAAGFQPFRVDTVYLSRSQEISAGGNPSGSDEEGTVAVTGVSLNRNSLSLRVGESVTLIATVSPSNATNKTVSWSSSETSRATVSNSGVVRAIRSGNTTITVTTADGNHTADCLVTIRRF